MRRFKGPNDVEEARRAVHKVECSFIKVFAISVLGLHVLAQGGLSCFFWFSKYERSMSNIEQNIKLVVYRAMV